MLNYRPEPIDTAFRALADPTRRAIVEQLSAGPASVSELAAPLPMSLPAVHQHLGVLEGAGLVASEKRGRTRWCRLEGGRLREVESWVLSRRRAWERKLDALGEHLEREKRERRSE